MGSPPSPLHSRIAASSSRARASSSSALPRAAGQFWAAGRFQAAGGRVAGQGGSSGGRGAPRSMAPPSHCCTILSKLACPPWVPDKKAAAGGGWQGLPSAFPPCFQAAQKFTPMEIPWRFHRPSAARPPARPHSPLRGQPVLLGGGLQRADLPRQPLHLPLAVAVQALQARLLGVLRGGGQGAAGSGQRVASGRES